jgi:glycosyltransferase involved in cell wall biosynthesis
MWPAIHPGHWGDGPLDARLLTAADIVFAQSHHEAATLRALNVGPEQIRVSPLGPAVGPRGDGVGFRAKHDLVAAPIVLFIGRKQPYKGYDQLLAAFPTVRRDLPEALLVTIGAGASRASGNGILDLGEVDQQTKADALAACDVFCMPSSGEAFGIVYVEAWSYGKPVIVGPAPAARELVDDGQTGLHADATPDSIAHAITLLLSNPALARRIGEAGRAAQLASYTWQAAWDIHTEGLLAARARTAPPRHPPRS